MKNKTLHPTHQALINAMRKNLSDSNSELSRFLLQTCDDEYLLSLIFFSGARTGSMSKRLTNSGYRLISEFFAGSTFEINGDCNGFHLLCIERNTKLPYHIQYGSLTLYDTDLALIMTMIEGDLNRLTEIM